MSIRVRVTLAFAAVMTLLLGTTGVVVHGQFARGLDRTIEESLRDRAEEIALLAADGIAASEVAATPDVPIVTVIGDDVIELRSPPEVAPPVDEELLAALEEQAPVVGNADFGVVEIAPGGNPSSVTFVPIDETGDEYIALGVPLAARNASLEDLRTLLWIALPLALILSSIAAWFVASAALRPVEAMRRRAAEVPVTVDGQRLPLDGGRDEVQRLGSTLNEMLGRIEGGVARERALVADASHELRTPLAALDAQLQLARRPGRGLEEIAASVERAAEESRRLTRVAEGLLLLARSDAGELSPKIAQVEIADWVGAMIERCLTTRPPGVEVISEIHPDLVAEIDPDLAARALTNLIDNAFRVARSRVTVAARPTPAGAEISVADDGPGFPSAFLASAFERFSRPHSGRRGPGAGLGLSIALGIVQAHGGSIAAENLSTGGALVTMEFPAG